MNGRGAAGAAVELRIAARPENVALARLALAGVAAVAAASPEEVADLKLAVSEVCTHALRRYGDRDDGYVLLRYTAGREMLTVEVEDTGDPHDGSDDALGDGALGLAIARAVTDELDVESGEAGNRVVLSKRLARTSA